MKKLFTFLGLLGAVPSFAQLTAGDIAIIGVNATVVNNKQPIAFIALRDIPGGTKITFTDMPYNNNTVRFEDAPQVDVSEGHFTWTAPSLPTAEVRAGEVIILEGQVTTTGGVNEINNVTVVNGRGTCTVGNNFYIGTITPTTQSSSDQIIAYLGDPATQPTSFLWGFSNTDFLGYNTTPFLADHTSDLPAALGDLNPITTNDNYFVQVSSNNAYFANGTLDKTTLVMGGRLAAFRKLFTNDELFRTSDANPPPAFPPYTFEMSEFTTLLPGQQTLSRWEFNGSSLDKNGGGDPVELLNGVTSAFSGSILETSNYPDFIGYDPTQPGGIMFRASTTGLGGVNLIFRMLSEYRAANAIKVEYFVGTPTAASTWTPVNISATRINTIFSGATDGASLPVVEMNAAADVLRFTAQANTPEGSDFMTFQVDFPPAIENQPLVYFRIVTAPDPNTGDLESLALNPDAAGEGYDLTAKIKFDFIDLTFDPALPLTLTSFTANKAGQTAQLNWLTEQEINVDRFEVQKSTNGTAFTTIASVGAKNQASNSYSYTDNQLTENTTYYRLNMIDKDGSSKYSGVQVVHNTATGNSNVLVSPTLAQNQITVKYNPLAENGVLVITNVQGQKVLTQQLAKGSTGALVGITQLPKGSYFVSVNGKAAVQFVKQ